MLEYGDKVIWYVAEETSKKVYIAFQIILKTSYARHFERVTTGSSHQSTTSSTESGPHVVTRRKASFMIALDLVGPQVSKTRGFEKSISTELSISTEAQNLQNFLRNASKAHCHDQPQGQLWAQL